MKSNFHPDGSLPQGNAIFVFGSNLAGRHGKGAALIAKEKFGAIYGQGEGLQGQSYGIPTKDGRRGTPSLSNPAATLPLETIAQSVDRFIQFAQDRFDLQFHVTTIGCGLAGYKHSEIAPLFKNAPANCSLPDPWRAILDPHGPLSERAMGMVQVAVQLARQHQYQTVEKLREEMLKMYPDDVANIDMGLAYWGKRIRETHTHPSDFLEY